MTKKAYIPTAAPRSATVPASSPALSNLTDTKPEEKVELPRSPKIKGGAVRGED